MKRFYLFFFLLFSIYQISIAQDVIVTPNVPDECTSRLERTTSDGSNNFTRDNFRNCISTNVYNNNLFSGRDDVYRLSDRYDFTKAVTIKMKATSNNRDLDLFVMNGSTCIASSTQSAGTEDIVSFSSWNSSWRIVVDGYNANQNGNYVIEAIATCVPDETNPPATSPCSVSTRTLICNSSARGDTRNESDNIRLASYRGGSCFNFTPAQEAVNPFTGNDVVYRLSGVDSGTPVTLRLNANTDLDMIIYRCFDGFGTHCISVEGATGSQNETVTIEWDNNYRIIIDSPNPSQNGSYTLSAICADPCNNPKEENCNNIDYEYAGNGGNLAYEFRVTGLPTNGSWTATRNGSIINLGTSSRVIRTFSTPGEYEICYGYTDIDGCEKFCCKRININNPYNCNLINSTKQGNNYVLSLPGINDSDVECWLVLEGNQGIGCLEERRSRVTVPVPTGTSCVRYCVKYYDRISRCYRVCCIEICNDPCSESAMPNINVPVPDCDFITYRYNRNIGGLSYNLSVPTNLPNNGTWEATSENGTVRTIGTGRSRNFNFPFAGKYLICYKYIDSRGCEQYCCRWIYIENPFDCNRIISTPNGNNNILSLSGISGGNIIEWIDDATGNVLNTNSSQITVPVPDPENCRYYSVIYFDPSCDCYRICCIRVCGPVGGGDCCPNRDANLPRIADMYRNICNCGVRIYCYNGNGFSGYFVHTGYLCCSESTGTIFDCEGNIRGVERVPSGAVFGPSIGEVLWDGCNLNAIETGPIGVTGPTGPTGPAGPAGPIGGQNEPTFLDNYPWLSDVVNFSNCSGVSIEIHKNSPDNFVYVIMPQQSILYNKNGTVWCTSGPDLNCLDYYSNGLIDRWTCGGNFTEEPCEVNPENCSTQRIANLNNQKKELGKEVKVYPNPNQGTFFIDFPVEENIKTVKVFDVSGKLIETFNELENDGLGQMKIDLSTHTSGMYLLQIDSEDKRITKRIVLE